MGVKYKSFTAETQSCAEKSIQLSANLCVKLCASAVNPYSGKRLDSNTMKSSFKTSIQIINQQVAPCRFVALLLIALLISSPAPAQTRSGARSSSHGSGISIPRLNLIDEVVNKSIDERQTPGAVVLVGHEDKTAWRKAYGNRALAPAREAMTTDTIFDLASLTKPVATATSIMILVERGALRLNDSITRHIPELKSKERDPITIEQLLTHTSGYRPDFDLREQWTGADAMLRELYKEQFARCARRTIRL
jgi:CubicO group peptidase (beta-lactamase class C family)